MTFELGERVGVISENEFSTGKIFNIEKYMDGIPAYVVEIDRAKQVDHHWGINRVLIDTKKLRKLA